MDNLISDGLGLMILGMGFVYTFLIVLIFATGQMSKIINRYFPAPVPAPVKKPAPTTAAPVNAVDPTIAAAIAAAIHQHRQR